MERTELSCAWEKRDIVKSSTVFLRKQPSCNSVISKSCASQAVADNYTQWRD